MNKNGTLSAGEQSALLYARPSTTGAQVTGAPSSTAPRVALEVERPTSATAERYEFEQDAAPRHHTAQIVGISDTLTDWEARAVTEVLNSALDPDIGFAALRGGGNTIHAVLDPVELVTAANMRLFFARGNDPRAFVDRALKQYRDLTGEDFQGWRR